MKLFEKINSILVQAHTNLGYDAMEAQANFSSRRELCELQCNSAFALAKANRANPALIASNLATEANRLTKEFSFSSVGGFLNIQFSKKIYAELLQEFLNSERIGIKGEETPKTIVVDYGGANIAKPLHVGHLRSAVIGQAVTNLARFMGNHVIADVHLGDWGLQMGLTISGLIEQVDCSYYFGGSASKPQITMDMLNEIYPAASKRSKEDEEFKKKAQETTAELQKGVGPYFEMWKDIKKVSLEVIEKEYKNLIVDFDLWLGESDSMPYEEELIAFLQAKNALVESDGALIVNIENENDKAPMPPCLIKASSGASLYATTDLATILMREKQFKMDELIYITDARQSLHFEQVFRVTRKVGLVKQTTLLKHIGFGTMNGKDGKPFKTREGGTLRLSDLTQIVTDEAKKKLSENNVEDSDNLSHKIGIAALKFGDMINQSGKDYVFDIEKFSSFEGKTGPYVLYSLVRIGSILEKNTALISDADLLIEDESCKSVVSEILAFTKSIEMAYQQYEPSIVCNAMYSLALTFSSFYSKNKVLSETDATRRNTLLAICLATQKALKIACNILGIQVPNKM